MSQIPSIPASTPSKLQPLPRPENPVRDAETSHRSAPLPYSLGAMFKKLENGRYAVTGKTGDQWDAFSAPQWRASSMILDPLAVEASNIAGSLAFAGNVANNSLGRLFHDIPALLTEAPAYLDEKMAATIGVNADELSLIAASQTPTIPIDDIIAYSWMSAVRFSKSAKLRLLGPELRIPAKARIHIRQRHDWVALSLPRSLFFPGIDVDDLVNKARRLPKQLQNNGNFIRIAEADHYVGLDKMTGFPTKIYTVVTDALENTVTTHPGLPDPKFALP